MFKRYQLVVFDWEGTIAENSLGYLLVALTKAAERLGLGTFDLPAARLLAPLGLATVVKKLFPLVAHHQQMECINETHKILAEFSNAVQLVPGVEKTIQWLAKSGMHLAIASNKNAQGLARVLQTSGLEPYFPITRTASDAPAKPCPQMMQEILQAYAMQAHQTLMVGDSNSDMEMAHAIGVDAVGMDFYHVEEAELRAAGALQVFDNYQDLMKYIKDN
ncbi:MAG TPA: HAD-IIIA family hydrolase [Legionellaceae bacterium]|nr:HAD-IIIA family hydrolase [Legionellaceae bacterium]